MRCIRFVLAVTATSLWFTAFAAPAKSTCDLLSKAEVEKVLGVKMRDAQPEIFGMCEYRSVDDNPYKAVHLLLEQGDDGSPAEWEKHERSLDPDVKPIVVAGIGDTALLWNRVLDARLWVLKGRVRLTLSFSVGKMMPASADTLPVARQLGQMAISRMP